MRHADRRSYLDAVDAERRRLSVRLVSKELLRKPETRAQRARMGALASELAAEARAQVRARGRRAFRGMVAVEIDLHAVGVEQPPASPPAVKAYLDILKGIAYRDDDTVGCLRVTRHALDNPWFRTENRDFTFSGELPRIPHGPESHVEVQIAIQPLRTYVADYDRAFALHKLVFGDEWDDDRDKPGVRFFPRLSDYARDDLRIDDLEEEERGDEAGRGVYTREGPWALPRELRDDFRQWRQAELRALRRKSLLALGPDSLDRPGPPSPMPQLMWQVDPGLKELQTNRMLGPGEFMLPAPPTMSGGPPWRETVHSAMTAHHGAWRMLDVLQGQALALDISIRGVTDNPRDLDNLARDIVGPFERVFCSDERGSVASYRAYPAEVGPPGVRVLVTADKRLELLEDAMRTARECVLVRGPRFRDD